MAAPPFQDLLTDKLLLAAKRVEHDGRQVPSLAGIPLLAKLGQGGMGAVYYGVHPRLAVEVAVKVLPFHLAEQQPDLIQRFFREAQVAAKVKSPHLVGVLDVHQEEGLYYLVMEFVDGISAGGLLKEAASRNQVGCTPAVALTICIAACKGLGTAHESGVVHRDIKPDNILLPRNPKDKSGLNYEAAKIADLGLARGEDIGQSLTGTQAMMGTPGYLAPEQAMDAGSVGPGADVFSMGATLYALLSGRAPFHGTSFTKIMMDTVQNPHPPITTFRPDLPAELTGLIDRCLAKEPARRFADANELRAALETCRARLPEQVAHSLPPSDGFAPTMVPPSDAARGMTPAGGHPSPTIPPTQVPDSTVAPGFTPPKSEKVPAVATQPPAPAAQVASVPPVPDKKGGAGKLVAVLVVLALIGGGGFVWFQNQPRGPSVEDLDREVAQAVSGAGDDAAGLRAALKKLDLIEARYSDLPSVQLTVLRQHRGKFLKDLKSAETREAVEAAIARAEQAGNDPRKIEAAVAELEALARKHGDDAARAERLDAARGAAVRRGMAADADERLKQAMILSADDANLGLALDALDKLEADYGKEDLPELKDVAALREKWRKRRDQHEVNVALAALEALAADPARHAEAAAQLKRLRSQYPGADLSAVETLEQQLQAALDAKLSRKEKFDQALADAEELAKTRPSAAKEKYDEVETLGKPDAERGHPDLLKDLQPDLTTRRTQLMLTAKQQLTFAQAYAAVKKQAADGQPADAASKLAAALKDLGETYAPEKAEAQTLLTTLADRAATRAAYEKSLADGQLCLRTGKYDQAEKRFDEALKSAKALGLDAKEATRGLELAQQGIRFQTLMTQLHRSILDANLKAAEDLLAQAAKLAPENDAAAQRRLDMLRKTYETKKRELQPPPPKKDPPKDPDPNNPYLPPKTLASFAVYANKPGQGIPLNTAYAVIPLRGDLDDGQYEKAMKSFKEWQSIPQGTKVRIEAKGTWYSGPFGSYVGVDGMKADGKPTLQNFRAFQGPDKSWNIAQMVIYISDAAEPGTKEFTAIEKAGHVWTFKDKDKPVEFVMPVTGRLRMQQNRDGHYSKTKGAVAVTVTLYLRKPAMFQIAVP